MFAAFLYHFLYGMQKRYNSYINCVPWASTTQHFLDPLIKEPFGPWIKAPIGHLIKAPFGSLTVEKFFDCGKLTLTAEKNNF